MITRFKWELLGLAAAILLMLSPLPYATWDDLDAEINGAVGTVEVNSK